MVEIRSSRSNSLASPVRLPLLRSFFSVLVAALGSSSAGYALAYPSSALLDLAELPEDRAFKNIETLLFGVSYSFFGVSVLMLVCMVGIERVCFVVKTMVRDV